jgi:hypothetical protein
MSPTKARRRPPAADGRRQHLDWLTMVEISGPFLTLPVLLQAWPTLDALDKQDRDRLRSAHTAWRSDPHVSQPWIRYVLTDLLGWDDASRPTPVNWPGCASEWRSTRRIWCRRSPWWSPVNG